MYKTIPVTDLTENQRRNFSCGREALDTYFKQFSKGNHLKNIGKTFVLLGDDKKVIGYYTISMGSIEFEEIPAEYNLKLPKYPIPIARIARLAVSFSEQGKSWGERLLMDAIDRVRDASSLVAAYGIVVDAKDEKAKSFYMHYGFRSFSNYELCLFLPIWSIDKL